MTAYYVIIESVTTLWLWVGWLWKCNIPMTQSVRRLSIIRSVCHNFLKGVICKIMHIIYKIVKMAPRHCSVVGCKSSSKTLSIYLPSLTVCPFNFVFFLSRCFLKILESCELLCCHKMQKFCKEKKWRPKKKETTI